jgi:hypothetical protein
MTACDNWIGQLVSAVENGPEWRSTAMFAGILAFTEHTFGLAPLGPNDSQGYDFRNAFNYAQAPRRPVPMVVRRLPWSARHIRVTPAMLHDAT